MLRNRRSERSRVAVLACVLVGFTLVACRPALAVPRYSARYEQGCFLCHVNPTGGGLRALYATQFLVPTEMSMRRYTQEQIADIQPQPSKNLTIGMDFRTIHHTADLKAVPYDNFLLMQGSVYLAFQVDPRFLAYVERTVSATGEVFGLGYVLPYKGYVKVGRFVPAYGWRFDDHTLFVRQNRCSRTPAAGRCRSPIWAERRSPPRMWGSSSPSSRGGWP